MMYNEEAVLKLIERLREAAEGNADSPWWWDSEDRGGPAPLLREAADMIEELKKEWW